MRREDYAGARTRTRTQWSFGAPRELGAERVDEHAGLVVQRHNNLERIDDRLDGWAGLFQDCGKMVGRGGLKQRGDSILGAFVALCEGGMRVAPPQRGWRHGNWLLHGDLGDM